jgi:hypothetical protein
MSVGRTNRRAFRTTWVGQVVARAESAQAAAPPSAAMKSRRFIRRTKLLSTSSNGEFVTTHVHRLRRGTVV